MTDTLTANCPECDAEIQLNGAVVNEILACPDCGVDLELTSIDPPSLELAPMEAEDWGE